MLACVASQVHAPNQHNMQVFACNQRIQQSHATNLLLQHNHMIMQSATLQQLACAEFASLWTMMSANVSHW